MSASIATQILVSPSQDTRHRRGHRGRGRGGHRSSNAPRGARTSDSKPAATEWPSESTDTPDSATTETSKAPDITTTTTPTKGDDAGAICWICAEPVKYYSLSACNHRTCHVCALRLRALYKKLECTFCKEPQATVIFTTSPDADFASYTPNVIPYKDSKLAICFETEEMMEDTLILLRFNCPDAECDYTASGWGDLKLHTRALHGKMLCDLCIRSKKVFAHEHALYAPHVLPSHLPSIPHRPSKQPLKDSIEGGTHPLCEFCRECFFGDDELFVHMRERHEECFLCKRNEIRDQYFQNYERLELHFSQAHFACTNAVCQAQKFVVFGSELDLKAHQVEVHGADMSSRDKRDARRVQAEFEFEDTGGGSRRGRRDRGDRERERGSPPHVVQAPTRPAGRRREAFGGHLTTTTTAAEGPPQVTHSTVPSGRASPIREDIDPLVAERHAAFVTRLQHVAPNPTNTVAAVKAAMRGYRTNEASARDLISTVWNVLDHNLDDTASIVSGVVDLLEEEEKKRDLLAAWNGFKIEQRQQFPDLVPTAAGSGYAGIASGRVLNAKRAAASRSSQQSSRQVWDRVAQAASASSSGLGSGLGSSSRIVPGAPIGPSSTLQGRFPPLASASPAPPPVFRQPQRQTPWSASSASGSSSTTATTASLVPRSVPAAPLGSKKKGRGTTRPPVLSATAFPELPTAQAMVRPKAPVSGNPSLRHIFWDQGPATLAWKANGNGQEGGGEQTISTGSPATERSEGMGKGKKGKGKQKQMLFTLGSFPT